MLNQRSVPIEVWKISHRQLFIELWDHCHKIIAEMLVIIEGETWNESFGDGQNDTFTEACLTGSEVETVLTAFELLICVAIPSIDVSFS